MESLGTKVIEGIVSGSLYHAYCPDDPEKPVLIVWSSGAAEQIEAIIANHNPQPK